MADTITVWINEDDSTIINDESDMRTNYSDILDEVYGEVTLGYLTWDASHVMREMDPTAYRVGFSDYCDKGWVEADMPRELWLCDTDDEDVQAWAAQQL